MSRDVNPMVGNCKYSDLISSEIRKYFGEPSTIIELGCGRGSNLLEFPKASILVGVEPFSDNYQQAKKVLSKGCLIEDSHICLSKFVFNQFHVGFTCSVLDHMEDFREALRDLCRICQNVMLFEPVISGPPRQAKPEETSCWEISWYHNYISWLSTNNLNFDYKPFPLYSLYSGSYFHQIIIYSESFGRTFK